MDDGPERWWGLLRRIAANPGRTEVWSGNVPGDARPDATGHRHPNPTAVICLEGVVRVTRAGRDLDLRAGDLVVMATGVRHQHARIRPGAVALGQGFLPRWSDVSFDWSQGRWFGRLPLRPCAALVDRILAAPRERVAAAAAAWLERLAEQAPVASDPRVPVLEPMVELMWRGSTSGLTAAGLVRASRASRSVAYDVFTRWYGLSPRAAILRNRLALAESLLGQGLPVAEVAAACGFSNPDTFTRCWRRAHGVPPRSWRRRRDGA